MKTIWQKHPVLSFVFALSLALAVFLGGRALLFFFYWHDPALARQPVAAWMTPRYVVHAYHLQPDAVGQVLGLEPRTSARQSLSEIAVSAGKPVSLLINELEALIAEQRVKQ